MILRACHAFLLVQPPWVYLSAPAAGAGVEHHLFSSVSGSYVTISDCSRVLFASREDTASSFSLRKLRK